jgi:pimeloyl-ACP methyl ester carboxylesterase
MVNESYEDELGRLTVPVALVWGTHDLEVPLEIARRSASLLHVSSTLTTVEGVGHLVPTDASAVLAEAVLGALR